MLKSRIEVREFAVSKAVEVMGAGTPGKDVVAKAKEIEDYIIGEAVLPDVNDDAAAAEELLQRLFDMVGGIASAPVMGIGTPEKTEKKSK